jgi:hypothetical protein
MNMPTIITGAQMSAVASLEGAILSQEQTCWALAAASNTAPLVAAVASLSDLRLALEIARARYDFKDCPSWQAARGVL